MNYEKVFEHLPNPYAIIKANSPEFTIVNASNYHLKNLKKTRQEVISHPLFDIFPPDDEQNNKVRSDLLKIIASPDASTVFTSLRYDIEGEERWWRLEYVPLCNILGEVDCIIIYSLDISTLEKLSENQK